MWTQAATSSQGTPWAARRVPPQSRTLVIEEPVGRGGSGFGSAATPGSSRRRPGDRYGGPSTPAEKARAIVSILDDVAGSSPRSPRQV